MRKLQLRPEAGLERKHYVLAAAAIIVLAIAAALFLMQPKAPGISKGSCESAGGTWNECGSPCIGEHQGTVCVQVCREQCEWFSTSAKAIQADARYSSDESFRCVLQENGIPMCWLPST